MSIVSKVIAQTGTHTHRHDDNITSTAYAGGNKIKKQLFSVSGSVGALFSNESTWSKSVVVCPRR